MDKLIYDGYNKKEIAKKTGLNVTDGIGSITANCSERYPDGFDYPYVVIHKEDGENIDVMVTTEVPADLIIN